jgi:hypothetical protein
VCLYDHRLNSTLIFIFIRILIATIRDKGLCPCPRCLVRKSEIDKLGQKLDARYRINQARTYLGNTIASARDFIYKLGYGIRSAAVERLLKEQSLVPTPVCVCFNTKGSLTYRQQFMQNAFAEILGPLGLDHFSMLVVDLMHEFELGIWKAVFIHLIRILYAAGPGGRLVAELDRR